MTTPVWNRQQADALDACARWLADKSAPQVFRIAGYAGVGKSTIAKHLAEGTNAPVFCAYTGKAASVLRKMGMPNASTIHALLYKPTPQNTEWLTQRREARQQMILHQVAPTMLAEIDAEIAALERAARRPRFVLNEGSPLWECSLIVADESSMITERMHDDLASFGKKMLILGDPGQLPPVQGRGYYDTLGPPDVLLTEIVRQAKDNPVIRYATMARNGEPIPFVKDGAFRKVRMAEVTVPHLVKAVDAGAQVLTGKNKTRRELNGWVRAAHGFEACVYPQPTERVVILKNDYTYGVFNGVTATVMQTHELGAGDGGGVCLTLDYDGRPLEFLPIEAGYFDALVAGALYEPGFTYGQVPVDFGNALTVHKSQGSQWSHVVVWDDGFGMRDPDVRRKWLYTAITRAAEKCTIVF
jgi:exodeoxyribonuclease-5